MADTKVNLQAYIQRIYRASAYSRAGGIISSSVAIASVAASILTYTNPMVRRVANLLAIGSGVAGLISVGISKEIGYEINDLQDIEVSLAQNSNYLARRAALLPGKGLIGLDTFEEMNEPDPEVEWFDLEEGLQDRAKIPHIMILGETGSGKSTLATALAKKLTGLNIAVDPHHLPGDYPTVDLIIGRRRNIGEYIGEQYEKQIKGGKEPEYETIGEPYIPFQTFLDAIASARPASQPSASQASHPASHSASISQFLHSLHKEMERRYNDRDRGVSDFEPINVIMDELPLYAKIDGFDTVFKSLLREARKVNIRLIVLTQGKEVKATGTEGEGSVRDSMRLIRIGKFATDYLKLMVKKDKTYQSVDASSVSRFGFFDDQPFDVSSMTR